MTGEHMLLDELQELFCLLVGVVVSWLLRVSSCTCSDQCSAKEGDPLQTSGLSPLCYTTV